MDVTAASDGNYVAAIDTERLGELINSHGAALVLYARQWCHAPDDALQEALIDLVRQDPVPNSPVAWLYKTVRRKAMNLARGEQRRAKHHRQASELQDRWFLPPDQLAGEPVDLEPLLTKLPRLEREIVIARIWGELSLQQIADLVDQSTSSVHRQYHRALAELGQMIDHQLDDSRQSDERQSPTA